MNVISPSSAKRIHRRAFSLVEVTLALGVAGFCLMTIFGLLPIGLSSSQVSIEQTMGANITSAILSDLQCAQLTASGTTSRFGFTIPPAGTSVTISTPHTIYLAADGHATGPVDSSPVTSGTAPSRYRATLGFAPPANGQRTATAVRLQVTWPAMADPGTSAWPQNYTGSYEADTTLDRN